ncbi:MAG TPA: hypothetical protein VIC24_01480 [Gemmatimonadaceae bacterium]|jgi:hypothetical protein
MADAAFNAEGASQGVPASSNVTLSDIITEKYIALFQQIEPWNAYKRTWRESRPFGSLGE